MLSLNYEYRVVPAPRRGTKSKDARSSEERFALSLAEVMNDLGRDGWEYVRSDTLPMDERAGLTSVKTSYFNMLVFRRVIVRDTQTYEDLGEVDGQSAALDDIPKPLQAIASAFPLRNFAPQKRRADGNTGLATNLAAE